jgi:hypothetical protein
VVRGLGSWVWGLGSVASEGDHFPALP